VQPEFWQDLEALGGERKGDTSTWLSASHQSERGCRRAGQDAREGESTGVTLDGSRFVQEAHRAPTPGLYLGRSRPLAPELTLPHTICRAVFSTCGTLTKIGKSLLSLQKNNPTSAYKVLNNNYSKYKRLHIHCPNLHVEHKIRVLLRSSTFTFSEID